MFLSLLKQIAKNNLCQQASGNQAKKVRRSKLRTVIKCQEAKGRLWFTLMINRDDLVKIKSSIQLLIVWALSP